MKTNPCLTAVVLALSPFAPSAFGAETLEAPPSPPPPAATVAADPAATPQPGQFIYSPRLPTAQELTNVAAARGVTVERIEQSANQVTVVYRQPDGQTSVVGYVLLPAATPAGSATVVTTPAPTVVYRSSPRVVYYDSYPYYYDGWYGWPPVSVSLGFGYGYYRGGYYHGGYYRGHGGGHRGHH